MEGFTSSSVCFEGHPEGLLDRDQRTVSRGRFDDMRATRVLARSPNISSNSISTTTSNVPASITSKPTSVSWSCKRKQHPTVRWSTIRRTLRRLGEALVIGVCILSVVRLPPLAMAAPVDAASPTGHPKWVNPCGLPPSAAQNPNYAELESEMASDYHSDELLERIIVTARNALMHAQGFREDYVRKTFNQGFSQFHDTWKSRRYDWLPSDEDIPKNLGERVSKEHLDSLKIETALRSAYKYLQTYAVGLEQVVWDQSDGSNFKKAFEDAEFKLRATLCEVQVTMLETNVNQPYDVERDIMDDRVRVMNDVSLRNLRDWVIYRDYMNGLEYFIQVFEYFKNK